MELYRKISVLEEALNHLFESNTQLMLDEFNTFLPERTFCRAWKTLVSSKQETLLHIVVG